jgi:hypothetical protein
LFIEQSMLGESLEDGTCVRRSWVNNVISVSLLHLFNLVVAKTNSTNKALGYPLHFCLLI